MKNMRKIFSVLLTVIVILSLSLTAFATEPETKTYSITIKNANSNHTYQVYQVLTGTIQTDGEGENAKKILINAAWGDHVKGEYLDDNVYTASATIAAGNASDYVNFVSTPYTAAVSDGSCKITVPKPGYYLVRDVKTPAAANIEADVYTAYILVVVEDGNVDVTPKIAKPTVEKRIQDWLLNSDSQKTEKWVDVADYAINESLQFKLTAKLPENDYFAFYDKYKIVFEENMSAGITFDSIESVKVGGVSVEAGVNTDEEKADNKYYCTATAGQAGGEWSLTIGDLKKIEGVNLAKGTVVEVIYNAHLNENATVHGAGSNKNTVYLQYSNNPYTDSMGTTVGDSVWVFTYQVNNAKTDEKGAALAGAGFKLYTDEACEHEYELVAIKDANQNIIGYRPAASGEAGVEMVSAATTGVFNIVGLDQGTYYLKETTVPAGYNACENIEIVISAELPDNPDEPLTFDESTKGMTNTIVNQSGIQLPSTGGTGTTLMYIIGGILVFVAVVFLVTKVKMKQN